MSPEAGIDPTNTWVEVQKGRVRRAANHGGPTPRSSQQWKKLLDDLVKTPARLMLREASWGIASTA